MKVVVERFKLYPVPGFGGRITWTYNYRVDDGPLCQYGPGLTDLRAILKRKYPDAEIVETWKGKS